MKKIQTFLRNHIVALLILLFLGILVWARLRPSRGIPTILFDPNYIDSIWISRNDTTRLLKNSDEILAISEELSRLTEIKPGNPRLNSGLARIHFYTAGSETSIRILYGNYDGMILQADELYYRGETMDSLINVFLLTGTASRKR